MNIKKTRLFIVMSIVFLAMFSSCTGVTTPVEFTITFNTNGGTIVEDVTYDGEQTITIPDNPTKEGYIFDGWYWDNESFERPFTASSLLEEPIQSNLTVYAKWVEQEVILRDQLENIYLLAADSGFEGTYEEWLETVRGPEGIPGVDGKAVYLQITDGVLEWQHEGDTTWISLIDFNSLNLIGGTDGKSAYEIYIETYPDYTGDEDQWLNDLINGKLGISDTFTVTFDSNGGSVIDNQQVEDNDKVSKPNDPVKEGYTFDGWYIDDIKWVFVGYDVTEDITLTAHWKANEYVVKYIIDDEIFLENQIQGVDIILNQPEVPIKTNSFFTGWYIDQNFNTLYDFSTIIDADIILYGKYEQYIIELTYADWGDQEFNQKMIDAFMEMYPYINVTLRSEITGSGGAFTGNLITAAQAGLLPDVFAIDNVPTIINAGLSLDVAEYWDADEDTAFVYDNIALTGVYNGKRYAVPSFQFLKGIMINLDIFEEANLTTVEGKYRIDNNGYPVKDWTFEEFIEIAKAIKNFEINPVDDILINPANTVIGLDTWYGSPDFQQIWPTMNGANLQYDTWDGTQFNYTSADWVYAMQQKIALHQLTNGTTTRFTQEVYDANAILQQYLIQSGVGAMDIEGSWQFWVINEAKETLNINLGFWPYPGGDAGLFPPTILDYYAVSSQTAHPEEAYLLAKWMTFGQDGWEARLDLLEEDFNAAEAAGEKPTYLDRFPIADYPNVWDRVYDLVDGIEGIDYIFNRIEYAKPDLDKWLPGYKDFWAWIYDPENPYNFDNLVQAGPQAVETYAVQWENKVNEIVQGQLEILYTSEEVINPIDPASIYFENVQNIEIDYASEFNILENVTAIGTDGTTYTELITYLSTSSISENNMLNTSIQGVHAIRYEVYLNGKVAQHWRYITVNEPVAEEGQILVNPDFSNGTMGWVDNAAYFVDQAGLLLTTEEVDGNPVLKAEVIAGANYYRPRFGQLNIPFELGKTYEISFDAKSSVDKTITIQIGELIASAPWIVDFIVPDKREIGITTEWVTYSFKFTMNLDNQNGGIIFGLGAAVPDEIVDATMWFDNFAITETTPDVD